MTKEFEINDILSAVNSIYELERKKTKIIEKKANTDKNGIWVKFKPGQTILDSSIFNIY